MTSLSFWLYKLTKRFFQVGEVIDMKSDLCGNLRDDEQVGEAIRYLEDFLLELVTLYIYVDKKGRMNIFTSF